LARRKRNIKKKEKISLIVTSQQWKKYQNNKGKKEKIGR